MLYKIKNCLYDIFEKAMKVYWFILPIIIFVIMMLFCNWNKIEPIVISKSSDILNISGTLIGFLFSTLSILLALPGNNYIKRLRRNDKLRVTRNNIFIGIISFFSTILLSILTNKFKFIIIFFVIGLIEIIISSLQLFIILKYSSEFENNNSNIDS